MNDEERRQSELRAGYAKEMTDLLYKCNPRKPEEQKAFMGATACFLASQYIGKMGIPFSAESVANLANAALDALDRVGRAHKSN